MKNEQTPNAAPDHIDVLAAFNVAPQIGETFTIGDREFRRRFVRLDAEDALLEVILDIVKVAPGQDLAAMFLASMRRLREAAAIIIADQEEKSLTPEAVTDARRAAMEWLATTRGVTSSEILDVVLKQIKLQEMGEMLSKLLTFSALTAAVTGRHAVVDLPSAAD